MTKPTIDGNYGVSNGAGLENNELRGFVKALRAGHIPLQRDTVLWQLATHTVLDKKLTVIPTKTLPRYKSLGDDSHGNGDES